MSAKVRENCLLFCPFFTDHFSWRISRFDDAPTGSKKRGQWFLARTKAKSPFFVHEHARVFKFVKNVSKLPKLAMHLKRVVIQKQ